MVLPKAGAALNNPDVRLPILHSDADGYYLEMRVHGDATESGEIAVTRRVPLDNVTTEEWESLKKDYAALDFKSIPDQGIAKGLEKLQDRRLQRLFMALLTFLNPRQVAIVLYLYKEAARQGSGPIVSFRSNDVLERLGYTRTPDGGFASKVRSQLNRDLVALHRTELVFAQSLRKEDGIGAKVTVKSVLRIKGYEIDNVPRDFDLTRAADYTYELADAYTVSLEFFEGVERGSDIVRFSQDVDLTQKLGSNAKHDYKMKLLIYLASRMKWDRLEEGQYLVISKQYLLKNLDLLGSNSSRNNQILWRTIEELQQEGYILEAQELPGDKKKAKIQFQIALDRLNCK